MLNQTQSHFVPAGTDELVYCISGKSRRDLSPDDFVSGLRSVQTRLLADDHFQTINWTKVCSIEISAVLISASSPSDICNIKPTAESNNQNYFFKNDTRLLQHH